MEPFEDGPVPSHTHVSLLLLKFTTQAILTPLLFPFLSFILPPLVFKQFCGFQYQLYGSPFIPPAPLSCELQTCLSGALFNTPLGCLGLVPISGHGNPILPVAQSS